MCCVCARTFFHACGELFEVCGGHACICSESFILCTNYSALGMFLRVSASFDFGCFVVLMVSFCKIIIIIIIQKSYIAR